MLRPIYLVILALSLVVVHASNTTRDKPIVSDMKPVIYTYFERIPANQRTTGMLDEDDDDLLQFWKASWSSAGWKTVVLTLKDAQSHPDYMMLQEGLKELDSFGCVLFHRWMAMAAVGGGWYADYDVFPLRQFPTKLPHNGTMVVHDIVSPTLASGDGEQWFATLRALLEDFQRRKRSTSGSRTIFWTDSLGIDSLLRHLPDNEHAPLTSKNVAIPLDRNDPVASQNPGDCLARTFRNKWAVHFGQNMLQMARHVPPEKRLPKHRLSLAKEWLPRWKQICLQTSNDKISRGGAH